MQSIRCNGTATNGLSIWTDILGRTLFLLGICLLLKASGDVG